MDNGRNHNPRQKQKAKRGNKSEKRKHLYINFYGEFDPGSGRTLAACLTHASRTEFRWKLAKSEFSGGRVSNAWITCPKDRDNAGKLVLIPDTLIGTHVLIRKGENRLWMDPRPIS
jgi:hypothetical protein